MAEFEQSVVVNLNGNLERRTRRFGRSMERFSKRGRRSLALLGKGAAAAGRRLDRMGNRFTALATGAEGLQRTHETGDDAANRLRDLEETGDRRGVNELVLRGRARVGGAGGGDW